MKEVKPGSSVFFINGDNIATLTEIMILFFFKVSDVK